MKLYADADVIRRRQVCPVERLGVALLSPLSNQSQRRTNESLAPLALQKRKLENCELRLCGETRAFRPENGNQ